MASVNVTWQVVSQNSVSMVNEHEVRGDGKLKNRKHKKTQHYQVVSGDPQKALEPALESALVCIIGQSNNQKARLVPMWWSLGRVE